jgi:hypothetical protein
MSWQKNFIDHIGDILRFIGYAFLAFDLIVLSLFSLWFVCNFVYRFSQFLARTIFDKPW